MTKKNRFPAGWNDTKVRRVLEHYEKQAVDEVVREDESASKLPGQTMIVVPMRPAGESTAREFGGHRFQLVGRIEPERDSNGSVREVMPQSRYRNTRGLPLNTHGIGPFCRFSIARGVQHSGVYVVTVTGTPAYVGKCRSLAQRFGPQGYGAIQPKNCFIGGQSTNCKINHLVLDCAKHGRRIDLWFHGSSNQDRIEGELISELNPQWNSQRQIKPQTRLKPDPAREPAPYLVAEPSPASADLEEVVRIFKLTLEKTYYEKGFFNVKVDFDRFVRSTEGPVGLVLGKSGVRIAGKVRHSANLN